MTRIVFRLILAALLFVTACSHAPQQGTVPVAGVPEKADVVIVGAGLSGLATAYYLKKAGLSVQLLELTPRLGGRVRTVRYQIEGEDLSADSGMEEYWESNPAVPLIQELKLPLRHDIAISSIVLQGKLHPLGDEDAAAFQRSLFNDPQIALLKRFKDELGPLIQGLHSDKPLAASQMKLKEIPFSEWVTKRLKSMAPQDFKQVAEWVRVSIECEIGTEWSRISALDGLAEFHIFLGHDGAGEESYRVIGGNDLFTDAIAASVGRSHIALNKKVDRIRRQGDASFVYYTDTTSNRHGVIQAKAVVSTIPIYRLSEVQTEPPLSQQKWTAIQSQKWGSYFKAHVFVPASAKHYWMNGENSILPILSDSSLGVIYDGNPDQNTNTKILSLLITGGQAEAFNFLPLDQVRVILKAQFEKLWPGFSGQIKSIEFYRYHPRAIAAWPVGRSRFDELSQEVRRPENGLYLAGDFTESSHSDGALISARRVSQQIIEGLGKR